MMRQEIEPTVTDQVAAIAVAPRLADLRGKRLGFVDNSKCNADMFIERLQANCPIVTRSLRTGRAEGRAERPVIGRRFRPSRGVRCGRAVLRRLRHLDLDQRRRRRRDRTPRHSDRHRVQHRVCGAARKQAAGRGMADLPLARIPHPMHTAPQPVVTERADAARRRAGRAPHQRHDGRDRGDSADRFDGANDIDDQEMFFARGWTDGLPVVPPTAEKVAAMVAASGRNAAESSGRSRRAGARRRSRRSPSTP